MAFREDFVWGAASSAYQTEGFPSADGGGESIWDAFCRRPGAIANGDNGSIACDGYHRFEEDIRLLSSLGLRAYRFSTSWARIDPNGDGRWNEAGLQYYDRVVDCCLANGVTPWMTLYHWELPQALEETGGWQDRGTAERFARFAGMMAAHFLAVFRILSRSTSRRSCSSSDTPTGSMRPGSGFCFRNSFRAGKTSCWRMGFPSGPSGTLRRKL